MDYANKGEVPATLDEIMVSGGDFGAPDVQLFDRGLAEQFAGQNRGSPPPIGRHALALGLAEARLGRELGAETAAGRSPGKSATQRRCLLEQIVTGHKKDRAGLPHGHAVLTPREVGHPAVKEVARLWYPHHIWCPGRRRPSTPARRGAL